ncbi:hypothetical protein ACHAXA_002668 [Cyclostephanos tholiformis]|uniref:Uncharacterized protein n=1 Tax=Cyclostephanos tholiformis TaxID=382380 RepID=A0ABD3R2K6_9STRA
MTQNGTKRAAITLLMGVLLYSIIQFRFKSYRTIAKKNEVERSRFAINAAKEESRRVLRRMGQGLPRHKAISARKRAHELLSKVANDVAVPFDDDDDDDSYENAMDAPVDLAIAADDDTVPILPINQRKFAVRNGTSGQGTVADVLPRLISMSARTRKIDETKLPYKCGAILYDHQIPGEGGVALNDWIKVLAESNDGASFISSEELNSRESYIMKVERNIQRIGQNDWTIIHSHRNGLAFGTDEKTLLSWRETVERRNCHFVAAVIFSDPLDHSIKHTKHRFTECDCSVAEFYDAISRVDIENSVTYEPLLSNPWKGQLDHFLSNSDRDTPMDTKDKIKMAMKVLKEHFDIVKVEGKGDFSEELAKITGWSADNRVKKASVSDKEDLVYSKELVSAFGKISSKNGDADFIDAVNHVYHSSLSFLVMQ